MRFAAPRFLSNVHHRRSVRLKGFDYSQAGAYFVTLCTRDRECLFGEVVDGQVALLPYGQIVQEEWAKSTEIRDEIALDQFIIMPNHLHGIVFVHNGDPDDAGAHGRAPLPKKWLYRRPRSLGAFIAGFKSITSKRINELRGTPAWPVWQRNYYERIIRNERELVRTAEYIVANPASWIEDENHPMAITKDQFIP